MTRIVRQLARLLAMTALPLALSACGSGRTISPTTTGTAADGATLARIQREVFTPYCASCHVTGGSGPMPLTDAATSYAALVGVDPTNSTARAAGLKRVVPGDPARSFLLNKLTGDMQFGEGDTMPQVGNPLSADQIQLIRRWIQNGAPQDSSSGPAGSGAPS